MLPSTFGPLHLQYRIARRFPKERTKKVTNLSLRRCKSGTPHCHLHPLARYVHTTPVARPMHLHWGIATSAFLKSLDRSYVATSQWTAGLRTAADPRGFHAPSKLRRSRSSGRPFSPDPSLVSAAPQHLFDLRCHLLVGPSHHLPGVQSVGGQLRC